MGVKTKKKNNGEKKTQNHITFGGRGYGNTQQKRLGCIASGKLNGYKKYNYVLNGYSKIVLMIVYVYKLWGGLGSIYKYSTFTIKRKVSLFFSH